MSVSTCACVCLVSGPVFLVCDPRTPTLGAPSHATSCKTPGGPQQMGSAGESGACCLGATLRSSVVTLGAPFIVNVAASCGPGSQMLC